MWHWPLLVLFRAKFVGQHTYMANSKADLSVMLRLALIMASVGLSFGTLHLVEAPLRTGKSPHTVTVLFALMVVSLVVGVVVGVCAEYDTK